MIHYIKQAFSWNSKQSKQKTGVQIVLIQIMLIMGLIVCSYVGVLAGLHRDWFYMVFFFFIFVFNVDCNVGFLMDQKMDTCFQTIGEHYFEKIGFRPFGKPINISYINHLHGCLYCRYAFFVGTRWSSAALAYAVRYLSSSYSNQLYILGRDVRAKDQSLL